MALSEHIANLIKVYKMQPNGERRNKIVSHLKDAEAHAKLQEQEDPRIKSSAEEANLINSAPDVGECTCRWMGGRLVATDNNCSVHGTRVA